jgi:SAM-dependent methyltransferase
MRSSRIKKEANFFDNRYTMRTQNIRNRAHSNLSLFYSQTKSKQFYLEYLREFGAKKKVLEYGCGLGSAAFKMSELGATVLGIDISEIAIKQARLRAEQMQLNNIAFHVMDAEALALGKKRFDLICGNGILHHLSLEKAFDEIARVLKPDGKAVFKEPLGYNPLINVYRILTPHLRTKDEHPLLMDDFKIAKNFFKNINIYYFDLFTLTVIPFLKIPGSAALLRIAAWVDHNTFRIMPYLKRWAGIVIIVLANPYQ